jgi:hypothetical protein
MKFSISQLWYKILLAILHCPLKYFSGNSLFLVNFILTIYLKMSLLYNCPLSLQSYYYYYYYYTIWMSIIITIIIISIYVYLFIV